MVPGMILKILFVDLEQQSIRHIFASLKFREFHELKKNLVIKNQRNFSRTSRSGN